MKQLTDKEKRILINYYLEKLNKEFQLSAEGSVLVFFPIGGRPSKEVCEDLDRVKELVGSLKEIKTKIGSRLKVRLPNDYQTRAKKKKK